MSPTDANAPECTSDVPPGLQAHAETRLRNAYAHAAAARRRELDAAHASTDPSAFAADPASDADARDPPDPTEGIAATIDALKTPSRAARWLRLPSEPAATTTSATTTATRRTPNARG